MANVWSMMLFVGNPTNIIVSEAYGIGFLQYSAWMTLPTIAGGITCYVACYFLFRRDLNSISVVVPKDLNENDYLLDRAGAIYGTCCSLGCLVCLVISSFIPVPIWVITAVFAFLMFMKDFYHFLMYHTCYKKPKVVTLEDVFLDTKRMDSVVDELDSQSYEERHQHHYNESTPLLRGNHEVRDNGSLEISAFISDRHMKGKAKCPLFVIVMSRLPWKILPFILSIFGIVYKTNNFTATQKIVQVVGQRFFLLHFCTTCYITREKRRQVTHVNVTFL
eukprot:TRINITY_DN6331_c0_g1_i4.p1 TRINITY_DN6331_c0_g1~~TRINITY_DN6331_c0_g1_i4.p1  ORF type:complete len:277 (-),score=41.94 TRINITY_DN6331_c0_g1_i4:792-1622(-)